MIEFQGVLMQQLFCLSLTHTVHFPVLTYSIAMYLKVI